LLAVGLAVSTRPALAVNSVAATPGSVNVAIDRSTTFTVTWRVEQLTGTPTTVSSTQGEFRVGGIGGTVLGRVNRTLSRAVPIAQTIRFTETVTIPRSVVFQATRLGIQSLVYVREFDDTTVAPALPGALALAITGSSSARFSISRIRLSYLAQDARIVVVEQGAELRPVAHIRSNGSGFLEARWSVAEATSSSGQLIPRTHSLVRRYLTAGGLVQLPGPALPTGIQGQYEVRFEVTDPALEFEAPRLLYYVRPPGQPEVAVEPGPIAIFKPQPSTRLDQESTVSWSAVPDATVYQVSLFRPDDAPLPAPEEGLRYGQPPGAPEPRPGQVVAGFYLPAEETESPLPAITTAHLEPGRRYYLRIIARGPRGVIVAQSELREVFF
jgi:hypothetical protein